MQAGPRHHRTKEFPVSASAPNLADAISAAGSAVEFLRNAQARPTVFPVAPEFSNWRSEQHSWRDTVGLLDQSHHMTDLFLTGPDALKLLSDLGVNSFERFHIDNAKQFIAVNHEGYLIGDAIVRQGPPKLYRYELQGPNALALLEKVIGEPVPATRFFHMTSFRIGETTVRALRHGMAGQPGFELFGPRAEGDRIHAALIEDGADLGLVQVGSMGYSSAN